MPSGKTRFNASWLHKIDNNGHHLGQWCKADTASIFSGFCYVCIKSISCSNNGVKQLISHADGISHKELMKVKLSDSQKHFFVSRGNKEASVSSASQAGGDVEKTRSTVHLHSSSLKEKVCKAETIWAFKVASSGY